MAQAEKNQNQNQTQTQRERIDLAPWLVNLTDQNGEVVGLGLILESPSHLPAREEEGFKETLGGLLRGFIDPQTGKPCTFVSKTTGEIIEGGLPIRLFEADAAALAEHLGERPARAKLHLLLGEDATASVYRTEDGGIAYVALRLGQVEGAVYRAPQLKRF